MRDVDVLSSDCAKHIKVVPPVSQALQVTGEWKSVWLDIEAAV